MRMLFVGLTAVAALFAGASAARAEVVDVSATGFQLVHKTTVKAPKAQVYLALLNVGKWWNPAHSYSNNAANLSIEPRPGGCWCEALPSGWVEHMRVVFAQPGERLRFSGGLGPLQTSGVSGAMEWALAEKDGVTTVTWTYSVGGYARGGFDKLAPGVDAVIGEAQGRFKAYAETGTPE